MPRTLLLFLVISAFAAPHATPKQNFVALDSTVTILPVAGEATPVQRAAEDLADDFEAVTGKRPRIISRAQDAGAVTVLIGEKLKLPLAFRPAGLSARESFSLSVQTANLNGQHPTQAVVLAGADMRGTMYAVYEFSQEYLGIDPLYFWTDHQPVQ